MRARDWDQVHASSREAEDGGRKFKPAGRAGIGRVINAGRRARLEQVTGLGCQIGRVGNAVDLVANDLERVPLRGQVQHQIHKAFLREITLAFRPEDYRCPHDIPFAAMDGEQLFAAQFRFRVDREGVGSVGFPVLTHLAIKYVVGAVVDERDGKLARKLRQGSDEIRVQREGLSGTILRAIDIIESDAVDYRVGNEPEPCYFGAQSREIEDVHIVAVPTDGRREQYQELAAERAFGPEDEHPLHERDPVGLSVQEEGTTRWP